MKSHEIAKMASGIIGKGNPDKEVEKDEDDAGDFEGMSIDRADNGYTVNTRHKQPQSKGDKPQPYNEGTKHVFADDHPAIHHILQILKHTKK